MSVVFDHSYGIIPLIKMEKQEKWLALTVQNRHSHYWGFPKGHPMPGEAPKEAASRELFEETGLTVVRFLSDKSFKENYTFYQKGRKIKKTVCYFLAEVKGALKLEVDEITDGKWIALDLLEDQMTFEEGKRLVREFLPILCSKNRS